MHKGSRGVVDLLLLGVAGAAVGYFLIGAVFSAGDERWFWLAVLSLLEVGIAALFIRSLLSR